VSELEAMAGRSTDISRFWATACKPVYEYLAKEGTSKSKDKRMAIEEALLKETLMMHGTTLHWIDGSQNIADALTKLGVDKTYLYRVLREAQWSVVQDPAAAAQKARKSQQRAVRKESGTAERDQPKQRERAALARQMAELCGDCLYFKVRECESPWSSNGPPPFRP
jgi:hypothetical protein